MNEADAAAMQIVSHMFANDRAARSMGIELLEVRAGYAGVAFSVREDMLNAYGSAQGGYIFALADTAFAYACNSRGETSVALNCSISFASPGRVGARLTASARERTLGGRTGVYDVEVVDEAGTIVALFRGTSYRVTRVG
jgi:acyl-CoA thioesterase